MTDGTHARLNGGYSDGTVTALCWTRCLWCGLLTPHELCHRCDAARRTTGAFDVADWARADEPPEQCADPTTCLAAQETD